MKTLITILLLGIVLSSEAQNISQSQVRQFNAVPAYRVFGRGAGVGTPSFITLDSNHIPQLHSQGYYDGRYGSLSVQNANTTAIGTKLNIADTANIRLRAIAGSNMTITGTYPNLTFNSTASGGSSGVASITAGLGLTGGTITSTGTVALDTSYGKKYFGYGILVINDSTIMVDTTKIKTLMSSGGTDPTALHTTGNETVTSGVKTFNSTINGTSGTALALYPIKITPTLNAANTSDTLAGVYINPTYSGTSINQYGIYSTQDISVKGVRIGTGKNTDQSNVVFGKDALNAVTTGTANQFTAIGNSSFKVATNASFQNTGIGYSSGATVTTGTGNTAVGANSMFSASAGVSNNVAVGLTALGQITGSNNVGLGANAGRNAGVGGVYIGSGAGQSDTRSNQLYIANSNTSAILYGDLSTGQVVVNARMTPTTGTVISSAQFQVNSNAASGTNRGSIPAPRMPQAQRDLIAVQTGVLTDVFITSNGTGCSSSTTVAITGGGGSGAAATSTFTNGSHYISITSGGTGYDPATTTVTFSGGGCATAPTGVPIIGAQGLSVYCTDCTATDASRGVLQYYNGSTWKNAW